MEKLRNLVQGEDSETELLTQLLHRFRCGQCHTKNCDIVYEHPVSTSMQGGHTAQVCAECGEAIPLKRLLAIPKAKFCVRCQDQYERPQPEEPVHCKKCGATMVVRIRESVLPTKYFLGCSNFPRCRFVISSDW